MGIVQAYLAATRESHSIDAQRRLLRQACTRLRTNFRHEEQSWPGSAPELEARRREHRHIIAGMERLLKARFDDDESWRGRFLHAMDELVILQISEAAARRDAAAH
jgi:hypothetical protein